MNELNLNKTDRKLAVLIDPDKHSIDELIDFTREIVELNPDFILVGGSLVVNSNIAEACRVIKSLISVPLILFPGHFTHLTNEVDQILLLSLISGRNPDLLIGQHVLSAPKLKSLSRKLNPTGYMLIDGGNPTSVSYMSNTQPIPRSKTDIATCTPMAGEALGLKLIYMDAGSGATYRIAGSTIKAVSESINIPLIVGGGLREVSHIFDCWDSGANLVVIGNGIEESKAFRASIINEMNRGKA